MLDDIGNHLLAIQAGKTYKRVNFIKRSLEALEGEDAKERNLRKYKRELQDFANIRL